MPDCLLSIILPCFNEEDVIIQSLFILKECVSNITDSFEILVVDDGSNDKTFSLVQELSDRDERIKAIRFTRNFGKEAAIHAGLVKSTGAGVVIIDSDLQHPPSLLEVMFKYWREDKYDIVEAVKSYDQGTRGLPFPISRLFNFIMSRLTGLEMQGASDYKLMDRKVVEKLLEMPENNRFFRGLVNWTGYRTKQVPFQVQRRAGGKTKWSTFSLFRLSVTAITAFSNSVLQLITILGTLTLVFSFFLIIQTLYNKISGNAVSGFTTVILLSLLLNSIIMISLGIIGVYMGNIYVELKRRPLYIIAEETIPKKINDTCLESAEFVEEKD